MAAKNRYAEFIGKPLDGLPTEAQWRLSGAWVALEVYTPDRLPLRIIEAAAATREECIKQLQARDLPLSHFELALQPAPYQS